MCSLRDENILYYQKMFFRVHRAMELAALGVLWVQNKDMDVVNKISENFWTEIKA